MKKLTALLLIAVMSVGMLAGCGKTEKKDNNKIEIDLATGSTDVHETVEDLLANPEKYIGKRIAVRGLFAADTEEYNDGTATREKFAVLITDSHDEDGCTHGIPFSLDDSVKYLPADASEIIVVGTFDKYSEKGVWHYHIAKALFVD